MQFLPADATGYHVQVRKRPPAIQGAVPYHHWEAIIVDACRKQCVTVHSHDKESVIEKAKAGVSRLKEYDCVGEDHRPITWHYHNPEHN